MKWCVATLFKLFLLPPAFSSSSNLPCIITLGTNAEAVRDGSEPNALLTMIKNKKKQTNGINYFIKIHDF